MMQNNLQVDFKYVKKVNYLDINANLRRIDLICNILSPLFFSGLTAAGVSVKFI